MIFVIFKRPKIADSSINTITILTNILERRVGFLVMLII